MFQSGSPAIARRALATLLAIAAADAAFVGVLLLLAAPLIGSVHGALAPAVPAVVWWAVIVLLAFTGLLAVQLRTARAAALSVAGVTRVDDDTAPDLIDRIRRLAALADVNPPAVGRVDSDVPNCFSVGGTDPMIVVSDGLVEALEDDELDAVLAHELAHIQNRDATVMTLATFLPTLVSDRPVAGLPRWLRSNLLGGALLFAFAVAVGWTSGSILSLLSAAALSLVVGGIALGAIATPVVYLSHRLSHDREFAADRAGAALSGDPEALASALRKLDDDVTTPPRRDLRSMGDLVEELCLLPHGFVRDSESRVSDDGFAISLATHPPTDERIDALQSLASEQEA